MTWADKRAMPSRIVGAIREHEDRSEILIGWVQLAVVAFWGALYAVAPDPRLPVEAPFRPIPWVLGFYAGFTLLRLAVAHRTRLPGWLTALSVVVDMGLLMATIWSFHVQYMQPASFYLKAPTLLYVFVFIALRALRFDARYVVLAGVVAALGWSALVVYALATPPGMSMITRDYIHYMTSNSILIGAEFDKVISILVVTAIVAVSLRRARGLLERAVRGDVATSDLSRFFAPEVARRITRDAEPVRAGEGEIREATIVYVDLRGFSTLAAGWPPATTMRVLAAYQGVVVPLVTAHGGSVDKFLGDGVLATFGATEANSRHAADALTAIMAIVVALDNLRVEIEVGDARPLRFGVAAASGPVVCGAVGIEGRLEYTVIGAPVNLAAKLEKHTKTENCRALVDLATIQLAVTQGYAPDGLVDVRHGRSVEGLDGPIDLAILA